MQTYDNLRQRKQLVTEAMARILASETKKQKVMWINLVCCRINNRVGGGQQSESSESEGSEDENNIEKINKTSSLTRQKTLEE